MNEHERAYLRIQQARPAARRYAFHGELISVSEIAARTGLSRESIRYRIRNGISVETPRMPGGMKPREYSFRGRLATVQEIMRETGLSRSQVSKRTDGIRFLERHELKDPNAPLPDHARVLFFLGINDSIAGWARRTGLPRYVIAGRLDMGWSVKLALLVPVKSTAFDTITFRGETKTFREWSEVAGINLATLYSRIVEQGWAVERALTEPVMTMKQRALYRRNTLLIKRMLKALSKEPLQDQTPQNPDQTGGQSSTSQGSLGTGAGSTAHDLHHQEGARA